ncbi:M48 family metallopeptidase [Telmatospirillum sp.]|uniref:M48 family metallopeptidase n=1 Tax=Telmatospirillum sp. TaxID=2079197 RepID=UPI00284D996C|nr:M48 family metallopeptidase [Telmatospirillum sp.]MDR3439779.1 M48 family metallopeptidase [Telmatospirillum sp.]
MVQANFFDGRSTRIRKVTLTLAGEDLVVTGEDVGFRLPFSQVKVDERLGQASRRLRFRNGQFCEVHDLDSLDALLSSTGHRDGWVDRMQRRRRFAIVSCVLTVLFAVAAYRWGLPWAAAVGADQMPAAVGRTLSEHSLTLMDNGLLAPSKIPADRQLRLDTEFHDLRLPEGGRPGSALLFRSSRQLGSNAFTLPDGTIILLDDLVTSIGEDQQILAVLAHELGHAHGHDVLKLLLQGSAAGAFLTFWFGDISQLLAVAPTMLVQAKYSRD